MKNTLTCFALFLISLSALADVCPTQIIYSTWQELDQAGQKRMVRILKKKGFILDNNGEYKLNLHMAIERSSWRGTPTDSKSHAVIKKDGVELARSEKNYSALMNDTTVSYEYGINEFVIAGATKEGVQRRLIKALKELPSCEEINEGSSR
jgi:hypothetical protein